MKATMRDMHALIMDEVSMISNILLFLCHMRLDEIFGGGWFGNRVFVIFGDLCQLPPVKGEPPYRELSGNLVKKITGHLNFPQNPWERFQFDELRVNERQAGEENNIFRELLSRARLGTLKSSDVEILDKCVIPSVETSEKSHMDNMLDFFLQKKEEGINPVCLFPTLSMVGEFNKAVSQALNIDVQIIFANDSFAIDFKGATKNAKDRLQKMDEDSRNTAGLEKVLHVGVRSKVMIRRNVSLPLSLYNGALGTIEGFTYEMPPYPKGTIRCIHVKLDHIGEIRDLERINARIQIFEGAFVHRKQFPLIVAFAITIHKSQGLTIPCIIADIGKSIFDGGMAYVALSRCIALKDLYLTNFYPKKVYAPKGSLEEYCRLKGVDFYKSKPEDSKSKSDERHWYKSAAEKNAVHSLDNELSQILNSSDPFENKKIVNYKPPYKKKAYKKTMPKKRARKNISSEKTNINRTINDETEPTITLERPYLAEALTFFPVGRTWQAERCQQLGLRSHILCVSDPTIISTSSDREAALRKATVGDGNCFFRSISFLLTGSDDQHARIREMMIAHVLRNVEQFHPFIIGQSDSTTLDDWINDKSYTFHMDPQKPATHFWADLSCTTVMSSLLKTSIYTFSPMIVGNDTSPHFWNGNNGWHEDIARNVQYPPDVTYDVSDRHILIDNQDNHFEPGFINDTHYIEWFGRI